MPPEAHCITYEPSKGGCGACILWYYGDRQSAAGLIAAAQKVEHYEIATYGTLCAWAEEMGHEHELELLRATLDEEKRADEKLTELAFGGENSEAEE
jgi:ferritin-like metal-binding protein YciE